jgi:stage 0 sporulation regulatory protein
MSELQAVADEIQKLRKYLNELIEKKNDLQDIEIISASKLLDKMLNNYEKLINTPK